MFTGQIRVIGFILRTLRPWLSSHPPFDLFCSLLIFVCYACRGGIQSMVPDQDENFYGNPLAKRHTTIRIE